MRIEHAVTLPRPADAVFPWLFDEDKVPRWTSGLEIYERLDPGPLAVGSRFRQSLVVSGQRLTFELHVVRLEPPLGAESTFETQGFKARQSWALAAADGETRLTQAIDAKVGSFTARMLAPIIGPRLQEKMERDLATLRELLA
jgi:carbon monoxide dehydrogenase subunit G